MYSLFQVDLRDLGKVFTRLYFHIYQPRSELLEMDFWEFENTIEDVKDILDEKRNAEDGNKQDNNQQQQLNKYKTSMPKTPRMPKIPKMTMPKI